MVGTLATLLSITDKPKLRWPLDVEQIEHQGKQYFILRDSQEAIATQPAIVPLGLSSIVFQLDGDTAVGELIERGKQYGLTLEMVSAVVSELQKLLFIENEHTRSISRKLREDYRNLELREAAMAGLVYPANPDELNRQLTSFIEQTENHFSQTSNQQKIVGLISPHIDYNRGWQGYGSSYTALKKTNEPELIILIGTSHQSGESLFRLSAKDFATPFGIFKTAREDVQFLSKAYGIERSFIDEFLHRKEHSLELQLPFIWHCFSETKQPAILPILVGSFHEFLLEEKSPLESAEVIEFISALAELIRLYRTTNRNVILFGGVDLAHVGRHFGDPENVSNNGLENLEQRDRLLLDTIVSAREDLLLAHIAEDCDKRRICGFPSIYTMLSAFRIAGFQIKGHLIDYRQAVDTKRDCIVTYASLCWSEMAFQ